MAKTPLPKHVSKKQQSRVAREHLQRRLILIATILVASLVVLIIGYGVLDQLVFQAQKPVAKVDGTKITLEEFQSRASYDRYQIINNMTLLEYYKGMFGFDENTVAYYDSMIQQNATLLNDPDSLGNQVIDELINDRVMMIQAEKMGITVSEEEVDHAIEEAFGFYKDGTPTPAPTDVILPTATYSPLQMTLIPPTATPGATATATSGPSATPEPPTATPTVTELAPTATTGPTATPFPTETPYTEEGFDTNYQNYVSTLEVETQFKPDQFRAVFRVRLIYEKLLEEVTRDTPGVEPYIWARHILVATEPEAAALRDRLEKGEDFAQLAAQYSTDTSNKDLGGDLGWFSKGRMVAEFEAAAFALTEIGQISQPVQTSFGWHIIQLLGREERPMTADRLDEVKQQAFDEWLAGIKEGMTIEKFENWKGKVPTIPTTPPEYLIQS